MLTYIAHVFNSQFPPYMFLSQNHYVVGWGLKTHRRLKNIIVLMEWIPSRGGLTWLENTNSTFSSQQEVSLKKAFDMVDVDNSGSLTREEVKFVLSAVDVDMDGEEGETFLSGLGGIKDEVTFLQVSERAFGREKIRATAKQN